MKNQLGAFLFMFLAVSGLAVAKSLAFEEAWKIINEGSAAQESSRLQGEAYAEAHARAARHWLPRLYIDAKSYQTDDPGNSFFGLLEQRALQASDFNPDSVNHPDSHLYTRGALGVDLPLFEGGMKSSQVDMYQHLSRAQEKATSQVQIEQYAQVGLSYGSLSVIEQQKNKLQVLNEEIERMIKGYQLGNKSNPVGYSGLLGMRSLANRLNGLIKQYEAQSKSHFVALNEMGLKGGDWSPVAIDSSEFVKKYLATSVASEASYKIETSLENVKASEKMASMERAKFLPRVGAFAESYVFTGSRNSANGYSAGLYLQWSLYDPANYGSRREALLKAKSAAKFAEASGERERAEREALIETIKSLNENINLLNDSYKILLEQSKMTATLFRNGSINALQIVEIVNRRADLIIQQGEAELGLLKASSELITKQKFDIAAQLHLGAQDEKR